MENTLSSDEPPSVRLATTFDDHEVQLRKRFGVRTGWMVGIVFAVGCVVQLVGYEVAGRQGVIEQRVAMISIGLNFIMASVAFVFFFLHRKRIDLPTDGGFKTSARVFAAVALFVTLAHSYLAGSHSTGILFALAPVVVITQRVLGNLDGWRVAGAALVGFIALALLESNVGLPYAPLLTRGLELRGASTHPLQTVALLIMLVAVLSVCLFIFQASESDRRNAAKALAATTVELEQSRDRLRKLEAYLPMCSGCKAVRDDEGKWGRVEDYIQDATSAQITHSICPDCVDRLYPDLPPEE